MDIVDWTGRASPRRRFGAGGETFFDQGLLYYNFLNIFPQFAYFLAIRTAWDCLLLRVCRRGCVCWRDPAVWLNPNDCCSSRAPPRIPSGTRPSSRTVLRRTVPATTRCKFPATSEKRELRVLNKPADPTCRPRNRALFLSAHPPPRAPICLVVAPFLRERHLQRGRCAAEGQQSPPPGLPKFFFPTNPVSPPRST